MLTFGVQIFLLLLLLAPLKAAESEQNWTPDLAIIGKLESNIKPGTIPKQGSKRERVVSDYARYYAGWMDHGHKMIEGEFIYPFGRDSAGIKIIGSRKELPRVFDGGCSIVHVIYSVENDRITSLTCNGIA